MKRQWWLSPVEQARLRVSEALVAALRAVAADPRWRGTA